ncbi:Uncharacterized protein FKW44_018076, partial [Caligus rogercresseyi]
FLPSENSLLILEHVDHKARDDPCLEDNTAYFGNNYRIGSENPQPSRLACRESCANHPECLYWTWGKGDPTGPCYLKTARMNVQTNISHYVSGSKLCILPEAEEGSHFIRSF